ncbi:MAG TPA: lamin tail domain-containing protein [Bacillota bacterium]|nr:lamin tail domain-containing protein [Bacillota bacterium]
MKRLLLALGWSLLAGAAVAQVQITEFMAGNDRTLKDDFGQYSDWIELYNGSANTVNLQDWALTDSSKNLTQWLFPGTNLAPNAYLVVFASGRNRRIPGAALHTNFKLDADGEYLALVRPNGSVATEFASKFPAQLADVSYGFGLQSTANLLISTNSTGRVLVPVNASLASTWMLPGLNDAAWSPATNGVGFETGQSEDPALVAADVLADNPAGYWRLGQTSGSVASNSGWILGTGDGQFIGAVSSGLPGPRSPAFKGFEATNLAVRLDGAGASIEVPFSPDLNPSAAFTIEAWVKPAQKGGNVSCPVSSIDLSSGRSGYALYQDYDAKGQWEFILGNSVGYIARATGGTVDTNNWQYLAGVFDGATARLYVNGQPVANVPAINFEPNTARQFVLGGRLNINPYYYAGEIDEVAVFGRALSSTEISNRYQVATLSLPATNYNFTALIKTDLRTAMLNRNSSAWLRLPFALTNPADIASLTLRLRYDDGFAAFLNGFLVAADNAPATLGWNSSATNRRPTADALQWRSLDLSAALGYLKPGTNLLALQGLNVSATNADFLLQAELEAKGPQYFSEGRYFTQPTPGAPNVLGVRDLGPILAGDGFFPALPGTNDSLTVTCRVVQAFAPLASLTPNWRVMYGAIQQSPMYDDGQHGDGAAGDGIYGAVIPNQIGGTWTYAAGQMVRWYLTAADTLGRTSRWPLFTDPLASAEYNGTVVQPGYVASQLPVFHLFVNPANFSGMDSESGARASFYYDGEFYDNIYIELRGNTTASFAKKSHRVEFNDEHRLRHPGPGGRIGKTSLMAEYMDPAYLRQHLSFWLMNQAGVPAAFHYPVRLQRNGQFYQLAFHHDVLGAEQLERLDYDREGALYKAAGTIVPSHASTGGFIKLLPKTNLTSTADFDALASAISETLPVGQRRTNAFDRLNLPEVINYLAVARWIQEGDDVWANMTVYRDTFGSGEWSIIPFDLNLSWGQLYYGNNPSVYGQIVATSDYYKSHPLYGGSQIQESGGNSWNRIYDIIIALPETRQMLLRRMRTLLDAFLQPPGTPPSQGLIEQHMFSLTNQFWAEAHLDRQLWGWPPNGGPYGWGPNLWLTNGVNGLINQFLNPRRNHFFSTHCATNTTRPIGLTWASSAGIPASQPTNLLLSIAAVDFNPASGNQDEEYVCLTNANSFAVDLSGWKLEGGISHRFHPGTVIPAITALYVTPNVAVFRARASAPQGGMSLFVQGNYNGHLNAWGETLTLSDTAGRLVSSNSFVGNPSLAQRYLRITEIMYNPAPAPAINPDEQQFEYVELKNISPSLTLNLAGVRFTNGIFFNFSGSAVTSLAPGQSVLVARNPAALTARYGSALPIAGPFTGSLDNGGETLRLEDAVGEKILEFTYDNRWYPITDGLGFSLVIVNENAPWDTWDLRTSWRPSGRLNGSPGLADPAPPPLAPVRLNEALTHSDPRTDWIELYNPATTNADIGGWFLTDDFYAPKRYRIPAGTVLSPGGYLVLFGTNSFELGTNAFRISEYGEQLYLFSGDAQTNLTGYCHGFEFGAAPNGLSFGRHLTSQGEEHFVLQSANTPGTNNALPRTGPIVIAEIMYHPPALPDGEEDALNEFIELHNLTATNVPLFCTFTNEVGYGPAAITNTWRLRNAVDYDFPTNLTLPPAGRLLVVSFDPVTNTSQLAAFRALYQLPTNVPIRGPWSGQLNNAGETLELKAPDKPDVTPTNLVIPYVTVDRIAYQPVAPWPTNANGLGGSLQRHVLSAYANDPVNWVAASPTAGWLNAAAEQPVVAALPLTGTPVRLLVLTTPGLAYQLEYKNDLSQANWTPIPPLLPASGAMLVLSDTNTPVTKRFYRVRVQ